MKQGIDLSKVPYICGPLTELPIETHEEVKELYGDIADVCREVLGIRAFVPHEHFDPIKHRDFTPADVDKAEREQVCDKTSVLIVVAIAPSWGGGIEVEMAYRSNVPVIILCEEVKLEQRKISRLLRGNPGIAEVISYSSVEGALSSLADCLRRLR